MDPFPHTYTATASGAQTGAVRVSSTGLPTLTSAPATQFGGPGTQWSPESLLAAAAADCFILTFRAVSAAGMFGWLTLECRVEGVLERVDRQPQFTDFSLHATLTVAPGADQSKARRLLERTGDACLIVNSLKGRHTLQIQVLERSAGADDSQARGTG